MKRSYLIVLVTLLMMPVGVFGQTYQVLWKQVKEAQDKDLPKTAIGHLQQLEAKAAKERAYGQLLKSTLLYARLQAEVAPDSLRPAVSRLERQAEAAEDIPLKAVYHAVLSVVYKNNRQLADNSEALATDYAQRAMAHPEALAAVGADDYVPFIIKGKDSEVFGNDLLSVVGSELEAWPQLAAYYEQTGNRRAACLTAVHTADDLQAVDSLIARYGDLPEAGELAMKRYELLENSNAPRAEQAAWLQEALRRWGSWQRANSLRNSWAMLTQPSYAPVIEHYVPEVNKPQTIRLNELRHLQSLTLRIYRTTLTGDTQLDPQTDKDYRKIKPTMTELKEQQQTLTFTGHEDYDVFTDSLQLDGLPAGVYLLEFATQPQTEVLRKLYFVSGIRVMSLALPDNRVRYVVVDATTGQPVSKASVRLSTSRSRNQAVAPTLLTTDAKGEVVYRYEKNKQPNRVYAYTPTDKFCPESNAYGRYYYYENNFREHTSLFTDRSIYRPGQTVHVAAIVWQQQSVVENAAVADKEVKFELRDANYKLVSEQTFKTDRYGKCAADFILPKGLLNGRFTIRANGQSTGFQVEDYKRPTFQVDFADYQEPYQQGDTVRAQGKAVTYAGVPVQGAKVKYTVRRKVAFWWLSFSRYWQQGYLGSGTAHEVVGEGEAVTADDGTFSVAMPMVMPEGVARGPMFYNFVVEADVTDVAGETHQGTLSLPLGTKPTALTCDIPQQVRKDLMPQVTFSRRNAAGREIAGTVSYRVDGGRWQRCAANAPLAKLASQLSSGEHRLEAVCEQDTVDVSFVVFSLDDNKPAAPTSDWFYVSHGQFPNDGGPVTLQVGSSDPDLHIVYSIFAGNKLIEEGAVDKDAALVNRKLTYKEAYGNGLLLTYAWVKNGVAYRHQAQIVRPMPEKKLKMTWETFRDRLTPGQQEEWTLKLENPDGTPADASLVAVLYDKSLDAIKAHNWSFQPTSYPSQPSTNWLFPAWYSWSVHAAQAYKFLTVRPFEYSRFDNTVYPSERTLYIRGGGLMMKSRAMATAGEVPMNVQYDMAAKAESASDEMVVVNADAEEMQEEGNGSGAEQVQVRENLAETAFFYPTLATDAQGRAVMRFTLPESLTTWRFMGVANTVDMNYGYIDGEAVAQKDVMVQPSIPRFVRQGDEAQLSARIFNTSDKAVSGHACLQLIDPENLSVVTEQRVPFSVEAGKTATVSYSLSVGYTQSLLVCKVVASGDGFSDGEQHYLPILPDREYVTKTVPYTQHGAGVKTIDLGKLFPTGTTQQKLTVEYTNNPAWLMVQSLPVVGQPSDHSAIDLAASYYSNLLAKTLLAQSPQVKTVFDQWKQEQTDNTLLSQLEKDQELKDLLLGETPWVAAADRETEQKQRLADFFDENGIHNRLSQTLEKLKKLQNADGSFSWYSGMQGSTSVTVAVEEMLVRLNSMAGEQPATKQLQARAFDYLGKEMVQLVAELKKEERKGRRVTFPSFTALRWLYLCAVDGRSLPSNVQAANSYLVALLKKDMKNQTLYEKALTAVVLAKHNEARKAAEYVKSLKEYSVYTEEMGRYYDTPRASYSWYDYKIPTEVAAIEAIQRVTPQDVQTVDEMRRWLLQEKRTQVWDTPINSVNAIYAFLNGHQQTLNAPKALTTLAVDGQPIDMPKATAGLGYVKTVVGNSSGQTFTATKTSEGTSWGAVYAQFFQKTADIANSQSGISVKREIIPSRSTAGRSQGKGVLSVGDRVKVRITIETTRDLDFVQVVDRRAACMEPVRQLSGFHDGAYVSPKDAATHYFYYGLAKGKYTIETEYYIDRAGSYETGTCTAGCAYAPEFKATAPSMTITVK